MIPIVIRGNFVPRLFSVFITAAAVTLWPFIFIKKGLQDEKRILNHEKIHIAQYQELLVIFFLILYVWDFLHGCIKYRDTRTAYYQIRFEQEAREWDDDSRYLERRGRFAWLDYSV